MVHGIIKGVEINVFEYILDHNIIRAVYSLHWLQNTKESSPYFEMFDPLIFKHSFRMKD